MLFIIFLLKIPPSYIANFTRKSHSPFF